MAKLVSFVVCSAINNIPVTNTEQLTHLVAPQIALRPQFIPGTFSFGVAVGIADIDLQEENTMRFTVASPDGNVIQDSGETPLPKSPVHDTMPKEYQGFMLNIDIRNLVVQDEGKYTFNFYINGDSIGEYGLPIYKQVIR